MNWKKKVNSSYIDSNTKKNEVYYLYQKDLHGIICVIPIGKKWRKTSYYNVVLKVKNFDYVEIVSRHCNKKNAVSGASKKARSIDDLEKYVEQNNIEEAMN